MALKKLIALKKATMVLKMIELGLEKKVWDGLQETDSFEEV